MSTVVWVLAISIWSTFSATTVIKIRFPTEEACEAAKATMTPKTIGAAEPRASCQPEKKQ